MIFSHLVHLLLTYTNPYNFSHLNIYNWVFTWYIWLVAIYGLSIDKSYITKDPNYDTAVFD